MHLSKRKRKITLLGSNSGRNAGDAAILATIISEISGVFPDVEFEVPTTNPKYIASRYPADLVKPISVMPWNLSLRLLGLPVFNSIRRSDLTLITDGIIFDYRLFNLAFNFVPSLVCLVRFANLVKKPIGCYDVGIGPVRSYWGKRMVRYLCNRLDFIMVREKDSYQLLQDLAVNKPPIDTYADVVFQCKPEPYNRARQILEAEGITVTSDKKIDKDTDDGHVKKYIATKRLIGFNLTTYVDSWLKEGDNKLSRENFMTHIAKAVDHLIDTLDVEILFFTTQIMDIGFTETTIQKVKNNNKVYLIPNSKYTHSEIMGVMKELDLFVGMRLHALIMASTVGTPVIGMVYAPKVKSFVELLGEGARGIILPDVSGERLAAFVSDTWKDKDRMKEALDKKVGELKNKVQESTRILVENYLLKD